MKLLLAVNLNSLKYENSSWDFLILRIWFKPLVFGFAILRTGCIDLRVVVLNEQTTSKISRHSFNFLKSTFRSLVISIQWSIKSEKEIQSNLFSIVMTDANINCFYKNAFLWLHSLVILTVGKTDKLTNFNSGLTEHGKLPEWKPESLRRRREREACFSGDLLWFLNFSKTDGHIDTDGGVSRKREARDMFTRDFLLPLSSYSFNDRLRLFLLHFPGSIHSLHSFFYCCFSSSSGSFLYQSVTLETRHFEQDVLHFINGWFSTRFFMQYKPLVGIKSAILFRRHEYHTHTLIYSKSSVKKPKSISS